MRLVRVFLWVVLCECFGHPFVTSTLVFCKDGTIRAVRADGTRKVYG